MDPMIGACTVEELPELRELCNQVFRTRRPGDMAAEYPLLFDPANAANLRVARADGRIVAHVGLCLRTAVILGARVGVASVGSVATHPDYRGHGLASRLMEDAARHSVEQGAGLMLISGTRGLYKRLRFVEVGSFQSWLLPANGDPASALELSLAGRGDVPALVGLQSAEPVRFERSAEDWNALLTAGMLMNQRGEVWLVRRSGLPAAYVAAQLPTGHEPATRASLQVMEFAGDRSALAQALPLLAARYGLPSATAFTVLGDPGFGSAAVAGEEVPFPGTVGILDPALFLAPLQPLVAARTAGALHLEPNGEGALLRTPDEEKLIPARNHLPALVFGGQTEEAQALPTLPPRLAELAARAFPLPLPWSGFNYV